MLTTDRVTAYPVPELERQGFLVAAVGKTHFASFRQALSEYMQALSERAERPPWRFYALSNGGFYAAPLYLTTLPSLYVGKAFEGRISSDAAGIIATLLALTKLGCGSPELHAPRDRLLQFGSQHPEWPSISRAVA